MTRSSRVLIGILAAGFLASGFAIVKLIRTASGPDLDQAALQRQREDALEGLRIPEFSLIDHNGKPFTRENLLGHVTIVDFFFTHCPTICPIMTETMAALTEALESTDVRFVSFSVDPRHDTPEVLREYAKIHDARLADVHPRGQWWMVTDPSGKDDVVREIVEGGLKFLLEEDASVQVDAPNPDSPGETEKMSNIVHPSWFVLLDTNARVRGLYLSGQPSQMRELAEEARELARSNRR